MKAISSQAAISCILSMPDLAGLCSGRKRIRLDSLLTSPALDGHNETSSGKDIVKHGSEVRLTCRFVYTHSHWFGSSHNLNVTALPTRTPEPTADVEHAHLDWPTRNSSNTQLALRDVISQKGRIYATVAQFAGRRLSVDRENLELIGLDFTLLCQQQCDPPSTILRVTRLP